MPYFYDCGSDGGGDPLFSNVGSAKVRQGNTTTTPNGVKVLTTYQIPAGSLEVYGKIIVHCGQTGVWLFSDGTDIIASGRTQSCDAKSSFEWIPRLTVSELTTLTLTFTAATGLSTDIYYHVMGKEI